MRNGVEMDILHRICSSERKVECETIRRLNDAPQEVVLSSPKVAQNVIPENHTKCHPRNTLSGIQCFILFLDSRYRSK